MPPSLRIVRAGLRQVTETLAHELARPGQAEPRWQPLHWQLAAAAAVAHGVSPLLARRSSWREPSWHAFLAAQREQVALRHRRIAATLERIDRAARDAGIAMVALKGAALHALGLYLAGDRPMADIDLLVRPADADAAAALLDGIGYQAEFAQWKHLTFKPVGAAPVAGLGEHRDTPVNIELHTRIHERLPLREVDIGASIFPEDAAPGLNPYPSHGALMSHLLLHAAGNLCGRSLRLIHLHDIALLAMRMHARDWRALWDASGDQAPWWALPPLRLVQRYYPGSVPQDVLGRLRADCPPLLRLANRRQDLTAASCSNLWLAALPGIEWTRSPAEAATYLLRRLRPPAENRRERAEMVRTQVWLQDQDWVVQSQKRRLLTWLLRPPPRMDTLYVVRAAMQNYRGA